jgi:signal transduction histidine kinase
MIHPSEVVIHIIDGGPGIPDAELEAVLQPFYRVETSRNRDTGGTGLGLAIAAQLTAQLDGKLKLVNRAEAGWMSPLRSHDVNCTALYLLPGRYRARQNARFTHILNTSAR